MMTKDEAKVKLIALMAEGKTAGRARDAIFSAAKAEGFWGEDSSALVRLTDEIELAQHGSHEALADAKEAASKAAARRMVPMTSSEARAFYQAHDHADV